MQSTEDDAAAALDGLRRLVRALRASSHDAQRAQGIGGAQLFVLFELAAEPGISLRRLSERTLTDPSSVSVVVARLVERGLILRRVDPSDARTARLTLSARGRKVLERAPEPLQVRLIAALRSLPPAALRQLRATLAELNRAIGEVGGTAPMFFTEEPQPKKKKRARAD